MISAEMRQSWGRTPLAPPNIDRDDADGSLLELREPFPGVGPDRTGRKGPGNGHGKGGSVQTYTAPSSAAVGPSSARIGEVGAVSNAGWALSLGAAHRVVPLDGIIPGNQNIIVVG